MSPTKETTSVIQQWMQLYTHHLVCSFKQFMNETDLSFSQLAVLMRLKHGVKIGVTAVGEQLGVSNAAASQAVDRLVNLGLIERSEDPEDRRSRLLRLTARGNETVEKGIEEHSEWVTGLVQELTPAEQELVISTITLLIEAARKSGEMPPSHPSKEPCTHAKTG